MKTIHTTSLLLVFSALLSACGTYLIQLPNEAGTDPNSIPCKMYKADPSKWHQQPPDCNVTGSNQITGNTVLGSGSGIEGCSEEELKGALAASKDRYSTILDPNYHYGALDKSLIDIVIDLDYGLMKEANDSTLPCTEKLIEYETAMWQADINTRLAYQKSGSEAEASVNYRLWKQKYELWATEIKRLQSLLGTH